MKFFLLVYICFLVSILPATLACGPKTVEHTTEVALYEQEQIACVDKSKTLAESNPAAFSINCVSPRHLNPPLHILRTQTALPICVYGNIGIPESEQRGWEFTQDVSEEQYASHARDWQKAGVSIIGGCCGTTPEYIRSVALSIGK